MTPLRIVLLGCGRIAELAHLPALLSLPDVSLVAVADSDAGRREAAARRVGGVPAFDDYEEAIARAGADAAVICLPPALHAPAAIAAFEAGLHVYLEKPVALDAASAHAVLDAWRAAARVGMIGFNYRFHPQIVQLHALIDDTFGDIVAARSAFTASPRQHPAWKTSRASGGGALVNLGSHHLDLAAHLFGSDVAEVGAAIRSHESEHDTAMVHLRLENGILVQSFFSTGAPAMDRWEVHGRAGGAVLDRYARSLEVRGPQRLAGRAARLGDAFARAARGIGLALTANREASYGVALRTFVGAARSGTHPAPDIEDGVRSLRVLLAAEASAARGAVIDPRTWIETSRSQTEVC